MTSKDPNNRRWIVLYLAGAALLGAAHWPLASRSGGFKPVADRKDMPGLTLHLLNGGEWNLADHRGQVVLINYWATWCGPCQEEIPGITRTARESGPKGLAVIGISLDSGPDAQARVQHFAELFRLPYPIALPNAMEYPDASVIGLPTTVLIDRHGRAAKTYIGAVERSDLAKDVAALLAES